MKTESQKQRIKQWLLSGKPITPIMALQMFDCFRLASVIHRLKHQDNLPIKTELVHNDNGNSYAKYYI